VRSRPRLWWHRSRPSWSRRGRYTTDPIAIPRRARSDFRRVMQSHGVGA
jgi:hypothetical protein